MLELAGELKTYDRKLGKIVFTVILYIYCAFSIKFNHREVLYKLEGENVTGNKSRYCELCRESKTTLGHCNRVHVKSRYSKGVFGMC